MENNNKKSGLKYVVLALALGASALGYFQLQKTEVTAPVKAVVEAKVASTLDEHAPLSTTIEYVEGIDYEIVANISIDESIAKPYVVEYFWLGCSHCQNLEPYINKFAFDNKVNLIKKPAPLKERWVLDAKIYYALHETDNMEHYNDLFKLYRTLGEERKLPAPSDLNSFFKAKGIDAVKFDAAMQSEPVLNQIKQNLAEMMYNKFTGVPKLVINGKYLAKPTDKIRTQEDYMKLVKFLVEKKD